MQLTCKQCGAAITSSHTDQAWVKCPRCQAVMNLTGTERSTDLAQVGASLPKKMRLKLLPAGFQIAYNWFSPGYIGLALMALIWNGFIFRAMGDLGWWIMIVPHFWVGLGMAAYALINLINKTTITITPDEIKIVHLPIPYPLSHRFDPITLKQLYVKEVQRKHKGSISYTYDLYMSTWSGRDQKLLSGIEEAQIALALEKEIERFLQVKDRAIPGEFTWLSESERNRLRQAWQVLAKTTSLNFNSEISPEKAAVSGVYRGHYLHLDASYGGRNRPKYTRMLLTPQSPPVYDPSFPTDEARLDQPLTLEVLLSLLTPDSFRGKEGERIDISTGAKKIYYEQDRLEPDAHYLSLVCDMLVNLAEGYAKLQTIGGEALPALETLVAEPGHFLKPIARQLIRDIAAETTARLGDRPASFYCLRCFTRCAGHTTHPTPSQPVTCYGCRTCRQSRALFECTGQVIAVLDSRMTEKRVEQAGSMRVNWLIHRALFDFEAVEIIQASDEDIERFAVQVGNDTDPLRQPHYQHMHCRIGLTCHLSENSLRVLRSVFGLVERGPLLADVTETTANNQRQEIEDRNQSLSS